LNEDCESLTFFNVGEFRENQTHIFNLNYELDTYYLLNIQVPHAVVNLNQDRYMLTIGLGQTYEEVTKIL